MKQVIRIAAFTALSLTGLGAQAQFDRLHGDTISVGATGPFSKDLTSSPTSGMFNVTRTGGGGALNETVSNHQQFTTNSVGFLTSLQFHPKPWAGIEMNYGYSRYSEVFAYNYSSTTAVQRTHIATDAHEATAAYQFRPRHIPFQPFVNIGGGAIDFVPGNVDSQWRGAGLLETGFDIPTRNKHIGFRVEGRSLFYRAPNFDTPSVSTRTWRATVEPSISTYYQF
jgi:hypothetical protein